MFLLLFFVVVPSLPSLFWDFMLDKGYMLDVCYSLVPFVPLSCLEAGLPKESVLAVPVTCIASLLGEMTALYFITLALAVSEL